ncbi:MAG: Xaa-Pro aminopeptidase [Deltaproteobacteria bacterium]|nr:Xaa-Pro aminopeptidase [Deltaproteobacteria bacterium]|tara:strand:+ start:89 stop:1453 length:1365 start_codon:yes stop_codon:yes gene_type:complete
MLDSSIYAERRQRLSSAVNTPILLMGNGERPRNLPMSTVAFRQDSSFLYFSGCSIPGASMIIVDGETTLYLPPPADDDALWHGVLQTIEEMGAGVGIHKVRASENLENDARALQNIATIAVPDLAQTQRAASIVGETLVFGASNGNDKLIDTIIGMRRITSAEEIEEMKATAIITDAAHRAAMAATRPGAHERDVAAAFAHVVNQAGLTLAYPTICTVRGEVLHNFHYENPLKDGQLMLLDGGAEAATGYATDVTRTWPVSGSFVGRQRAAYDAVLEAQLQAIDLVRPNTRYRDVHTCASLVLAQFLADEGLITIDPQAAVECGAHALFFPHGVGHLIGLDVHDLENFGDRAAYPPDRQRSSQFGTCYLRLDLDLEPGMVVTVEPGFYVVPAILNDGKLRDEFSGKVNFSKAESWVGFGGIRIEDDVLVTHESPDVITGKIPKHPNEMLDIVGG